MAQSAAPLDLKLHDDIVDAQEKRIEALECELQESKNKCRLLERKIEQYYQYLINSRTNVCTNSTNNLI